MELTFIYGMTDVNRPLYPGPQSQAPSSDIEQDGPATKFGRPQVVADSPHMLLRYIQPDLHMCLEFSSPTSYYARHCSVTPLKRQRIEPEVHPHAFSFTEIWEEYLPAG